MSEGERHNLGVALLLGGLVLLTIGCYSAAFLAVIGFFAMLIGGILALTNYSNKMIEDDKKIAQAQVNLLSQQVKAGRPITTSQIDQMSGYAKVKKQEETKKETKKIIKGAVAGGIVAGDIGAVAGAVAAKNKIDREKENKL